MEIFMVIQPLEKLENLLICSKEDLDMSK